MRRDTCAACGWELTDFLDLGSTPLANSFPETDIVQEHWYPLQVAVCQSCWLVQQREVVPDDELFGDDYGFRTGTSAAARGYFSGVAGQLLRGWPYQAGKLTVEIGCNDGTLLRRFADAGCPVYGVEPSGAAADVGTGVPVVREPFTLKLAEEMSGSIGRAGLILAFNVVAHVPDPQNFLLGVRELLADDGVAVVEFQDLAALAAGCQFDHVYHEHRFFYSRGSFSRLAGRCGLKMYAWEWSPAQGGSIRAYLEHGLGNIVADRWLESMDVYRSMQGRADFARRCMQDLVKAELEEGRVVAGYGATAKSCTLLNFCGFGPQEVQWIGDITPGKIGRFSPGTRIPIRAFGERTPDTYLLTAWNFAGQVIRQEQEFLRHGGRVIIPGAVPVII